MLLSRHDVIRKKNEAPAHLQERNALGRVARLFCGICAVVCPVQVLAPCGHFSLSDHFRHERNAQRKKSVPWLGVAAERREHRVKTQ
jgi:formate hydrogenlyase subunit 6/NADH:ubiquinone oxidoreductase subunit I